MARLTKLHLGAGHYNWPGWTNLDEETFLHLLPYEDGTVDEIACIHLFEHLPRLEVHEFLNNWYLKLVPHGTLIMEMPSLDKMAQLIVNGETNTRLTLLGIFGDPRDWEKRPLMRHEWSWTNVELEEVLTKAGFEVEFAQPVFHIKIRDLRVIARKV